MIGYYARMLRFALTSLSALSLALCVVTTWLWVNSLTQGNYWDTPAILHLGGLPAVYVAAISGFAAAMWFYWATWRFKATRRTGFCTFCDPPHCKGVTSCFFGKIVHAAMS